MRIARVLHMCTAVHVAMSNFLLGNTPGLRAARGLLPDGMLSRIASNAAASSSEASGGLCTSLRWLASSLKSGQRPFASGTDDTLSPSGVAQLDLVHG